MVLATAAQMMGAGLELGAAHVRCSEHGELTHVAQARQIPGAFAEGAAASPSMLAVDERGGTTGHEHCPFSALLNQSASTVKAERFLIGTLERETPPTPSVVTALPAEQRPLLATAPKTSPPRA